MIQKKVHPRKRSIPEKGFTVMPSEFADDYRLSGSFFFSWENCCFQYLVCPRFPAQTRWFGEHQSEERASAPAVPLAALPRRKRECLLRGFIAAYLLDKQWIIRFIFMALD